MAKIKQQIKKTSSVFLIISLLLNFSIYGLIFNLNFDQLRGSKLSFSKEVQAANTASTSVTIRNSPPVFVQNPVETVASGPTTPVNVGGSVNFSIPADAVNDQENNDIALLVCSGGGTATTSGGTAHCLTGVQYCLSSYASSTQTNSSSTNCTYDSIPDPGAEFQSWTAFVCDAHPSQPVCSLASSGSGDSGSPYYVNHAPTVVSATTSVNNVDPGSAFTVTATINDTDVQGGADDIGIAVCSTNAWSTTTNSCAAATFCTSTVSAGASHSCSSTTTIPTAHGTYQYWVFAKDWHDYSTNSNQNSSYNINDVAPVVSDINLNNGSSTVYLNIKDAPDKLVLATSTSISDNNGCSDLVSATSTIYESAAPNGMNCTADDNNCYATTSCVISECSGGNDTFATVVCSFSVKYHAQATDAANSNPRASDIWTAAIMVFDGSNSAVATNSSQTVEVMQTAALDITENMIDYGILVSGTTTAGYNATTTVNNFGNSPIDGNIFGDDMNGPGGIISAPNQKFDMNTATYASLSYTLSSTTPQLVGLNVTKPTSVAPSVKWVYWGINVPSGLISGDYGGRNTFSASVHSGGAGW